MERRGRETEGMVPCASGTCETSLFALFVGPVEQPGDDLEDLEFLGVGAVEREELEEVICYDLSVVCR